MLPKRPLPTFLLTLTSFMGPFMPFVKLNLSLHKQHIPPFFSSDPPPISHHLLPYPRRDMTILRCSTTTKKHLVEQAGTTSSPPTNFGASSTQHYKNESPNTASTRMTTINLILELSTHPASTLTQCSSTIPTKITTAPSSNDQPRLQHPPCLAQVHPRSKQLHLVCARPCQAHDNQEASTDGP